MNKKLKELKDKIDKEFGAGSIMLLGNQEAPVTEIIETGIYSLDRALGVGGIPRGRMIELYGPEGAGKTTIALYIAAAAQQKGGIVAFVDVEHSLNLKLAKTLGVKTDELLISQPNSAEEALSIVESLTRSGDVAVIIVDSVAALVPQVEVENDMGASNMGVHARLMSQACRKLTGILSKTNTTLVWINQIRHKIGVMFGNPETTTGGNALKFYCSQRLEIRRGEQLKDKEKVIGHNIVVKVVKNKLANPFTKAEIPLIYGVGIDIISDITDVAIKAGVIEKSGSWFSYDGKKLGQGKNSAVDLLSSDEKILNAILTKLNTVKIVEVND